MRKKRILYVLLLVLAVFLTRQFSKIPEKPEVIKPYAHKPEEGIYYKVLKVHDGDTVTIDISGRKEKIRLIGIDTPEMGQRPWGKKARDHIEGILSNYGGNVSLESDVEKRDRYGRLLAYLWTEDGRLINRMMVEDGYAVLLTIPPNVKHVEELKDAQRKAREGGLGIWGDGGLKESPVSYRKRQSRR
jgi:micrococcal nuclease